MHGYHAAHPAGSLPSHSSPEPASVLQDASELPELPTSAQQAQAPTRTQPAAAEPAKQAASPRKPPAKRSLLAEPAFAPPEAPCEPSPKPRAAPKPAAQPRQQLKSRLQKKVLIVWLAPLASLHTLHVAFGGRDSL